VPPPNVPVSIQIHPDNFVDSPRWVTGPCRARRPTWGGTCGSTSASKRLLLRAQTGVVRGGLRADEQSGNRDADDQDSRDRNPNGKCPSGSGGTVCADGSLGDHVPDRRPTTASREAGQPCGWAGR
jgi:hypothetical protein